MEGQATPNGLGPPAASAASAASPKEPTTPRASFHGSILPYLVLDRVLDYLDDESDDRHDLWSFSLTCRRYCEVADRRRFRQIVVAVPSSDELDEAVAQLRKVLSYGRRYAFVHRLRFQGLKSTPRHYQGRPRRVGEPLSVLDSEKDPVFDAVHPFCRLKDEAPWFAGSSSSRLHEWEQFASLLRDLPALRDLIWTEDDMPRVVLDAVHFQRARRCRLHMSAFRFKLHSLIYDRARPQSVSADDYALMTSPSLCSVSARMDSFASDGSLDYNDYALQLMMAGLAPNLANVWLSYSNMDLTLELHSAYQMGRPEFPGLFIGDDKNDDAKRKDSNKGAPLEHVQIDIGMWSFLYQSWNTTNLRRLHIQWTSGAGHALAALAFRGELASVETLWLAGIHKSSDGTCSDIHDIIGHIPALHDLRLTGNVTNAIFDTILHHHNATIRSLYLQPYEEDEFEEGHVDDDSGQLFAWSPTMIQQLAENCLLLEAVFVEVARTRGDRNEVALYRALGTMQHLKHLLLHLICPLDMGPGSEELDGNPTKITADAHKTTFTNAAVDKTLARSIFNVISREGQGCLQTLHLIPEFHARYHTGYTAAVRALTLPWACTRQANGEVVVEAIHKRETKDTIEECAGMIEGNKHCLKGQEEIYPYVFMELWPGNEPWWEGWTSLPLDLS